MKIWRMFDDKETGTPKAPDHQDPAYSPGEVMADSDEEGTDSDEQASDEDDETPGTPPSGKKKRRLSAGKNSGATRPRSTSKRPKAANPDLDLSLQPLDLKVVLGKTCQRRVDALRPKGLLTEVMPRRSQARKVISHSHTNTV